MRSHPLSNRVCRNCRHLLEAGLQAWSALDESRLRGICQAPPRQGSLGEPDCALDDVRPGRPRRRLPNVVYCLAAEGKDRPPAGKQGRLMGRKRQTQVPYYEQVATILRAGIISADRGETMRLPTERELCTIHHVSRITIRKAMDILEREGLIQRAPSRGTLTVPKAIRQWKHLRQDRVVHVLTTWLQLADMPASFYGQIYQGVLGRCEKAGYQASTLKLPVHRTELALNLQMPDPDTTLGIILIGLVHETMIQLYTDTGLPVVVIDYSTTNPQADSIVADCFAEGQTAAEFLVRQGHRDLFYIGNRLIHGPKAQDESDAEVLLAGYQRAIKLADLPPLAQKRVRFFYFGQVAEAVQWFLSLSPRPTAGLIFNDGFAGDFIEQLRIHGVRCPEDVSIIAKGSVEIPDGLACLRTDAYKQGELAVDCLLDRAGGKRSTALHMALPSHLERGRTVRYLGPAVHQTRRTSAQDRP